MRLRHITGSEDVIAQSPYVIHEEKEKKGQWKKEVFKNDKPLYIEVGMGKGRFIIDNAVKYPEINFVGIEKYSTVCLKAIQKLESLDPLPENVKFLCIDAKEIEEVFDKEEVDRIYLNFSDPWPKDRHAKRRLPSREFLRRFGNIIKKGGSLEFKTDNRPLFDFALSEVEEGGWKLKESTFDLHHNPEMVKDNIMTEYEEKFSSIGNPICKYILTHD